MSQTVEQRHDPLLQCHGDGEMSVRVCHIGAYIGVVIFMLMSALVPMRAETETPVHLDSPVLKGPYLGQEPPGVVPEVFAPFIVGPEHHKHSAPAFSPDGQELFFSVYFNWEHPQVILYMRQVDGVWTRPEVALFSGTYQEGGPVFSPDGNRVYFYSKRPLREGEEQRENTDIWFIEKTASGWGEPRNLGPPVNRSGGNEYPSSITPYGSILLGATTEARRYDVFEALWQDSGFTEPINLGAPVNAPDSREMGACLAPDGRTLVYFSYPIQKPWGRGLYWSQADERGNWSVPQRMGDMINEGLSRFPMFSPDGEYMFFTSYRSGTEEIYWVDASVIDYLKNNNLNLIDVLSRTVLDSGFQAALDKLNNLRIKHADYYVFDKCLLNGVGDRLLAAGDAELALEFFKLNHQRFPDSQNLIDTIKLVLVENKRDRIDSMCSVLPGTLSGANDELESGLNRLGHRLLRLGCLDRAITAFRMNIGFFPNSPNVHNSYGEALLNKGDTALAIESYRKVLDLEPANKNAVEILRRLGQD
ncbi:MAG: PD40 domain-containing protein [Candidatus Zixiibacteriota bacterium]|nr:MAG: PD40 domain-containing protein [candidate division Zixibacteria bacterium]